MPEPLGVLLLPAKVEDFELADHARDLLAIPRVLALEPGRVRTPRLLRHTAPIRTAKHLRFPGKPRLFVLYHPLQYPLARALCARYREAELWYIRPNPRAVGDPGEATGELTEFDRLARERATDARVISQEAEPQESRELLRGRLRELGIISPYPFVPGARIPGR